MPGHVFLVQLKEKAALLAVHVNYNQSIRQFQVDTVFFPSAKTMVDTSSRKPGVIHKIPKPVCTL